MRVVTLKQQELEQVCFRLAQQVTRGGYVPDVVLGILTGGGYVGRIVYNVLNVDGTMMYDEVETHRPGHAMRRHGTMKWLMSVMPRWMLDLARIAESKALELYGNQRRKTQSRDIRCDISPEVNARLMAGGCSILVVDDAIDSGVTMASVIDYLAKNYPKNEIKTAVVTVTTASPVVAADYRLFSERELVRFPWSNDMK